MIAPILLAVALAAPTEPVQTTTDQAKPASTKVTTAPAQARPTQTRPAPAKSTTTSPLTTAPAATTPAPAKPVQPAAADAKSKPTGAQAMRPFATDRPVRVDADEVRFNWKTRQVTMVGKPLVTLVHDDATLTCRRLIGDNDAAGKLKTAVCEGDVRLVRAERLVTCERATYDRDAARVVCTGNPVVHDPGGTEARATTLTYDLAADEVSLVGEVIVTTPGDQIDAAVKGGKPPGDHP